MKVNVERSQTYPFWKKGTRQSGTCFTISYDRFEQMLREGGLPFPNWKLKQGEYVERFVTDEQGVTVYIGNCRDSSVQRGR